MPTLAPAAAPIFSSRLNRTLPAGYTEGPPFPADLLVLGDPENENTQSSAVGAAATVSVAMAGVGMNPAGK